MSRFLLLRLDAPLTSFGGIVVDNRGVEMPFPAPSAVTGLIGNALGFGRTDYDALQRLQQRLHIVVRIDRPGIEVRDFQTAELDKNDHGWTTHGEVETRAGGAGTYAGKHIRLRDFHADRSVLIAAWLEPADETPTLTDVQDAVRKPYRPLFIGRKPCIPATYLDAGLVEAASPLEALRADPPDSGRAEVFEAVPEDAPLRADDVRVSGLRNWRNQVHGGEQRWQRRPWVGDVAR